MQLPSFVFFILAIVSIAAASPAVELTKRQRPYLPCSKQTGGLHVIAASGDGVNNIGGYGLLKSLADSILRAIPGSTNVTLPYDKGSSDGVGKTTGGARNMVQYITDYQYYCPNTKQVLLGYSAGGIITMNTLCGASPPPWQPTASLDFNKFGRNLIAAVVYGDETHQSAQPYNRGTCTGSGKFPRTNTAGCNSWKPRMRSWCNADDPQCCKGFEPAEHFNYPTEYDQAATNFVVNQFNRLKNT